MSGVNRSTLRHQKTCFVTSVFTRLAYDNYPEAVSPHTAVHPKDFLLLLFFFRKVAEFLNTFHFFFEAQRLRRVFSFRREYGAGKGSSLGAIRCPGISLGLWFRGSCRPSPPFRALELLLGLVEGCTLSGNAGHSVDRAAGTRAVHGFVFLELCCSASHCCLGSQVSADVMLSLVNPLHGVRNVLLMRRFSLFMVGRNPQ